MSACLYKALIEANASEAGATEAAREIDTYKQGVAELKVTVRIIPGLLIAILVILVAPLVT